jgi:hypothetical protein
MTASPSLYEVPFPYSRQPGGCCPTKSPIPRVVLQNHIFPAFALQNHLIPALCYKISLSPLCAVFPPAPLPTSSPRCPTKSHFPRFCPTKSSHPRFVLRPLDYESSSANPLRIRWPIRLCYKNSFSPLWSAHLKLPSANPLADPLVLQKSFSPLCSTHLEPPSANPLPTTVQPR